MSARSAAGTTTSGTGKGPCETAGKARRVAQPLATAQRGARFTIKPRRLLRATRPHGSIEWGTFCHAISPAFWPAGPSSPAPPLERRPCGLLVTIDCTTAFRRPAIEPPCYGRLRAGPVCRDGRPGSPGAAPPGPGGPAAEAPFLVEVVCPESLPIPAWPRPASSPS